jgi:molybdenum cofactor biosynthesis enzyme MoaA
MSVALDTLLDALTLNVAVVNDLTDEEVWSMVQYVSKKKLRIDLS